MTKTKIYVAGSFKKSDEILQVRNPFDNSLIAETYLGPVEHLEEAIQKSLSVLHELRDMPAYKKSDILFQISSMLEKDIKAFARTLSLESGKPIKYALGEVLRSVQVFRVAAEESRRLPKEYIDLEWTQAAEGKEGIIKYFPIGLVAGISPFNFPLNLAVHKIAPAIAAGCPIILKPASSTPLSTLRLAEIIHETALPEGALSVIPMDRKTGNLLVTDPRIKMLSFTGSPEVGWKMKEESGKKKVILELGGNAGVIVSDSADIDDSVKKCVLGGFAYSGQICVHAQRFFVQDNVFDEFKDKFILSVKALKSGNPIDDDTDISVMIDEDNAIRVNDWINEAALQGAEILLGGHRTGSYVEPTILTNTSNTMKVCAKEVFGPVVTLERYTSYDKAISEMNDGNFGLQAGVFTNRIDEMNKAFTELDVGGVIINDVPTFRVDHMPYGGIKDSGLGREGLKYAIHDMMEAKILVKNK